jgi:hypothetical protein
MPILSAPYEDGEAFDKAMGALLKLKAKKHGYS